MEVRVLSVERRRFCSVVIVAVFIMSTMLALFASFISNNPDKTFPTEPSDKIMRTLGLAGHAPITIVGNAAFTGPNASTGVTRGSGTASDPYVIEGWAIGDGPSSGYGILVSQASAHFVIQDCYTSWYGSYDSGICLNECSNGVIRNCTCYQTRPYGIYLADSSNNILVDNDCSDNRYGIFLYSFTSSSGGNILINNTCLGGSYCDGIHVEGGSNNTLVSNNCSVGNEYGILLKSTSGNLVCNSSCYWNYAVDILLWGSSDNIVCNNTCSSQFAYFGIRVSGSGNTLFNNTCSENECGISIGDSSNCLLLNNTCLNNDDEGVIIDRSVECTIRHNEITGSGIIITGDKPSHYNSHEIDITNTANGNPICYFKNETGFTAPAGAGQVLMANCTDVRIENENLSDTCVGIELAFCEWINVTDNNCSNNSRFGAYLYSCRNTSLVNNTCSNMVGWDCCGIFMSNSDDNVLSDNTCSNIDSYYGGICLSYSINNSLVFNNCSSDHSGMYLVWSSNNTILNSICNSNVEEGILLISSCDNDLIGNNLSANNRGVSLSSSGSNTLINNIISNSTEYGLFISGLDSSNNRIWNNTFYHNNGTSDTYDPAHIQAYDDGTGNRWNSTNGYGNYWSDWTTPDDLPRYGIVDGPYDIDGSAGAQDFYPLTAPEVPTEPIPEFGMMPFVVMALLVAIVLAIRARRRKAR